MLGDFLDREQQLAEASAQRSIGAADIIEKRVAMLDRAIQRRPQQRVQSIAFGVALRHETVSPMVAARLGPGPWFPSRWALTVSPVNGRTAGFG